MAVIKKKCWPEYFQAIVDEKKKFELRLNDFEAHEGDTLILEEWDPKTKRYTGRKLEKKIASITRFTMDSLSQFWPREDIENKGLQVFSLE
jgi:ribosomal protein S17